MEFHNIGIWGIGLINTGILVTIFTRIVRLETLWKAHKETHEHIERRLVK